MLLEEIKTRKSVRSYSEQKISDDILNEILEAGRLAPSWVNVQPWKFIVIRDEKTKELIDTKHRNNLFKLQLMPAFKPDITY